MLLLFFLFALLAAPASAQTARAPAARPESVGPKEFTISNFRTESGTVLPKAIVVYGTYGTLNAARDNAKLAL